MQRFLITVNDRDTKFEVGYDQEGTIRLLKSEGELTEKTWLWVSNRIPFNLDEFIKEHKAIKWGTVVPIEEDLSFDRAWNEYSHKMGNKARAEKLWDRLEDADKTACFYGIKKYKFWKAHNPQVVHLLFETFLNQRRWENDYTVNI